MISRLIVHQFDPMRPRAGGIDTCISDLIAYAPAGTTFGVLGVTSTPGLPLGTWHEMTHRNRDVLFMPVARLWQTEHRRIPHSAMVAAGLVRWRRRLPLAPVQVHRLDLGAVMHAIGRNPPALIQFIHNPHGRKQGVVGPGSDSFWRFAPWLYHCLEPPTLRRADRVIVFSGVEAQRLRLAGIDATPWQTWYDPATFFPGKATAHPAEAVDVAWVGRFERQKDPTLALETLAELVRRGVPLKATFLGEGSMRSGLERRVAELKLTEAVSFAGAGDRCAVAALLRRSRVLLLTSRYEGSPRILIEALATGTPVAATQEADSDMLIVPMKTGAKSASHTPRALADALLDALRASQDACVSAVEHLRADVAVPRLIDYTTVQQPQLGLYEKDVIDIA
jgi:glycosyltransferase involved in cell wall biosynthesis